MFITLFRHFYLLLCWCLLDMILTLDYLLTLISLLPPLLRLYVAWYCWYAAPVMSPYFCFHDTRVIAATFTLTLLFFVALLFEPAAMLAMLPWYAPRFFFFSLMICLLFFFALFRALMLTMLMLIYAFYCRALLTPWFRYLPPDLPSWYFAILQMLLALRHAACHAFCRLRCDSVLLLHACLTRSLHIPDAMFCLSLRLRSADVILRLFDYAQKEPASLCRAALFYWGAMMRAHYLPLLYDAHAARLRQFVVAILHYVYDILFYYRSPLFCRRHTISPYCARRFCRYFADICLLCPRTSYYALRARRLCYALICASCLPDMSSRAFFRSIYEAPRYATDASARHYAARFMFYFIIWCWCCRAYAAALIVCFMRVMLRHGFVLECAAMSSPTMRLWKVTFCAICLCAAMLFYRSLLYATCLFHAFATCLFTFIRYFFMMLMLHIAAWCRRRAMPMFSAFCRECFKTRLRYYATLISPFSRAARVISALPFYAMPVAPCSICCLLSPRTCFARCCWYAAQRVIDESAILIAMLMSFIPPRFASLSECFIHARLRVTIRAYIALCFYAYVSRDTWLLLTQSPERAILFVLPYLCCYRYLPRVCHAAALPLMRLLSMFFFAVLMRCYGALMMSALLFSYMPMIRRRYRLPAVLCARLFCHALCCRRRCCFDIYFRLPFHYFDIDYFPYSSFSPLVSFCLPPLCHAMPADFDTLASYYALPLLLIYATLFAHAARRRFRYLRFRFVTLIFAAALIFSLSFFRRLRFRFLSMPIFSLADIFFRCCCYDDIIFSFPHLPLCHICHFAVADVFRLLARSMLRWCLLFRLSSFAVFFRHYAIAAMPCYAAFLCWFTPVSPYFRHHFHRRHYYSRFDYFRVAIIITLRVCHCWYCRHVISSFHDCWYWYAYDIARHFFFASSHFADIAELLCLLAAHIFAVSPVSSMLLFPSLYFMFIICWYAAVAAFFAPPLRAPTSLYARFFSMLMPLLPLFPALLFRFFIRSLMLISFSLIICCCCALLFFSPYCSLPSSDIPLHCFCALFMMPAFSGYADACSSTRYLFAIFCRYCRLRYAVMFSPRLFHYDYLWACARAMIYAMMRCLCLLCRYCCLL